ncbi:Pectin lyase fold/virulence factor [Phaffia rhodozyma]|uniref:Pectin lyase fold/virulence factor n=1 Tax=Phaffia rhodozyma TaxID=264483 RepID=A0A0F7SHZ3_PHARH|nr:Pectin lyase fold/virulence factor [Phaffia rhodozyma]
MRYPKRPSFAFVATSFVLWSSFVQAADSSDSSPCLSKGDENTINRLFSDGGPSTKVQLCRDSTFNIAGPIHFTARDQELSTQGYPNDGSRAQLIITGDAVTAVQGDCRRCARVAILNIRIDGRRRDLGRATPDHKGGPLIVLGNNEGQRVERCSLMDPRGWAAVHIREGDNLGCVGAIIEWNEIGPVGEEWIEELDGPDPEMSPLGRPLGDGVSLSCKDSIVSNNVFTDTSDAAVVIFGSPGSTISHNTVLAKSSTQMGGILMVDYGPWEGAYTSTVVSHNTINALGSLIRVAIGVGTPVWSDDFDTTFRDGTVIDNVIKGYWMGYGIVVAGVSNFTVMDNLSTARHSGLRGSKCPTEPVENSPPVPFVYNTTSASGEFQEDFVNGAIQYVVCIESESDLDDLMRPVETFPEPEPEFEEIEPREPSVLDTILDHSKQRVVEAIEEVHEQIQTLRTMKEGWDSILAGKANWDLNTGMLLTSLSGLSTRVANLESERKHLRTVIDDFRDELDALGINMDHLENRENDMLNEIFTIVRASKPLSLSPPSNRDQTQEQVGRSSISQSGQTTDIPKSNPSTTWLQLGLLGLLQGVLILFYIFGVKWRRQARSMKTV